MSGAMHSQMNVILDIINHNLNSTLVIHFSIALYCETTIFIKILRENIVIGVLARVHISEYSV